MCAALQAADFMSLGRSYPGLFDIASQECKEIQYGRARTLNFLGWASISPTVRETLTGVFHSNILTNLALLHIVGLPLDVLDGCVALQELSLELVTFEIDGMKLFLADDWKPATPRERRTQLESLHLALHNHNFIFFSMWITSSVCSLDITILRRFSVSLTAEYTDPKTLKIILQPCATTLEIFCFNPAFRCTYINIAISFLLTFLSRESKQKRSPQSCRHQYIVLTSHSTPPINTMVPGHRFASELFLMDFRSPEPTASL